MVLIGLLSGLGVSGAWLLVRWSLVVGRWSLALIDLLTRRSAADLAWGLLGVVRGWWAWSWRFEGCWALPRRPFLIGVSRVLHARLRQQRLTRWDLRWPILEGRAQHVLCQQ